MIARRGPLDPRADSRVPEGGEQVKRALQLKVLILERSSGATTKYKRNGSAKDPLSRDNRIAGTVDFS